MPSVLNKTQATSNGKPADMNHVKNIALVGAGGRLGSLLADTLVNSNHFTVTAISRPDSQNTIPTGIHSTIKVNYNDKASIVDALRGQDVLVITMSVRAQPNSQQLLIDAAIEAGVKYIVPNEWAFAGAESTVGEESGLGTTTATIRKYIESAAKGHDVHWISITCGFWYEFSLVSSFVAPSSARFGFNFKNKAVTFFDDDGKIKIHSSTWNQVSRALAALLSLPIQPERGSFDPSLSQFNDCSVHIASFEVSQKDMFESILRVRGELASDWTINHEDTKARFDRGKLMAADKATFMEGSVMRMYSRIFWPDGSGAFGDKLDNEKLGLPEESLDEATARALTMLTDGSKKI